MRIMDALMSLSLDYFSPVALMGVLTALQSGDVVITLTIVFGPRVARVARAGGRQEVY